MTATLPAYNFAYLDEQTKRMIRRAILKAIAIPGYQVPFGSREMPMPYGWGTGGVQVTAVAHRARRRPEGHRPGRRRHHQRGLHPPLLRADRGRRHDHAHERGDHHPDPPPHPRDAAARGPDPRLPGADPRAAALPRAARDRDAQDARARGVRADARQALRGHRAPRSHRHDLRLPGQGRRALPDGPVADPEVRQPEDGHVPGAAAVRRGPREAHLCGAALHAGGEPRLRGPSLRAHALGASPARCAAPPTSTSTRSSSTTPAGACSSARTPTTARRRRLPSRKRRRPRGDRSRDAAARRRGPHQVLRAARRLRRRLARAARGRGAGGGRRVRARARRRCSPALGPARADARQRALPHARRRRARPVRAGRGRAPAAAAHRLGLRAPGRAHGPAHGRVRGRQRRRAPDGGRRAPLRPHPQRGAPTGWPASRSRPTASTIRPRRSRAACGSACRSPATW